MAPCYAPHATLATMTTNDLSTDLDRIADLRATYDALAPRVIAGEPWPLAEDFGTGPEASWGPREVLAHLVEMLPFWLGELERVVDGDGTTPVPFGRIADDPSRLAMIERERTLPLLLLFERLDAGLAAWADRLPALTAADLAKVGLHPRNGEMAVAAMPDRFAIGHAEDHARQLEETLADADADADA